MIYSVLQCPVAVLNPQISTLLTGVFLYLGTTQSEYETIKVFIMQSLVALCPLISETELTVVILTVSACIMS